MKANDLMTLLSHQLRVTAAVKVIACYLHYLSSRQTRKFGPIGGFIQTIQLLLRHNTFPAKLQRNTSNISRTPALKPRLCLSVFPCLHLTSPVKCLLPQPNYIAFPSLRIMRTKKTPFSFAYNKPAARENSEKLQIRMSN